MDIPVSITSISSLSSLGATPDEVWQSYLTPVSCIQQVPIGNRVVPVAMLTDHLKDAVMEVRASNSKYADLDDSVLFALLASRNAVQLAGWGRGGDFGINIGSSRGATALFEKYYGEFLQTGTTGVQASPSTTLGNIASWVAQDLKSMGPDISHSITCSTALHALLNGVAWIRGGMAESFLVGGSEAPLTPFTIAQMKAMKIYSSLEGDFPCRALDLHKKQNTMVLGEGAAAACLEKGIKENAIALIEGVGYATEALKHSVSISANAECLQKSMKMALGACELAEVDAVVLHSPGTIKGDSTEYNAIKAVFGDTLPLLTTNKWKTGHTFGASGLLSLEMAVLMIEHNQFIGIPFLAEQAQQKTIRRVLVNAVGFGGNAVSVLISGRPV